MLCLMCTPISFQAEQLGSDAGPQPAPREGELPSAFAGGSEMDVEFQARAAQAIVPHAQSRQP